MVSLKHFTIVNIRSTKKTLGLVGENILQQKTLLKIVFGNEDDMIRGCNFNSLCLNTDKIEKERVTTLDIFIFFFKKP
jgi:hypothetical protein